MKKYWTLIGILSFTALGFAASGSATVSGAATTTSGTSVVAPPSSNYTVVQPTVQAVQKKSIIILPFNYQYQNIFLDVKTVQSLDFQQILTTSVVNSNVFTVLERADLKQIFNEIQFQQSGLCDVQSMTPQLKGADLAVIGTIMSMQVNTTKQVIPYINETRTTTTFTLNVIYELVNVSTGVILKSNTITGTSTFVNSNNQYAPPQTLNMQTLYSQALQNAATQITAQISQ
ncbi:MAG: hypothetical protein NTX05_02590 [Fusobacteria bacterium]|nr:hypothetical protein [Fusobacteriota bacterium]